LKILYQSNYLSSIKNRDFEFYLKETKGNQELAKLKYEYKEKER